MVPTDGDFAVKRVARCPIIFPTWLPDQEDSLSPRPQDWQLQSAATHIMSQEGGSEISEQSGLATRSGHRNGRMSKCDY